MSTDIEQHIVEQVKDAATNQTALNIIGGNSKAFYGRSHEGQALSLGEHSGIVSYEPTELVITARAGTKISELKALLAENNQMLGFEPTLCNADSTLGGVVAAGLAGSSRAYTGSVRDFILGVRMINGHAETLNFGGQVMKNVAGFDHSRLMAGSLGTLGVLLEISLRVLPLPKFVATIKVAHADPDEAIIYMNKLSGKPYPISAAAWMAGQTYVRLSGTQQGVKSAVDSLKVETDEQANEIWPQINAHQIGILSDQAVLYRLSVPAASPDFSEGESQLIDWGGAQRWLADVKDINSLRELINPKGATLTVFRGGDRLAEVFHPLDSVSMKLHQNIKQAFDPKCIFNPGRMYKNL